ncbi:uncharacterized protein LOC131557272 [Ammospiza caudacuta]|uniref:uncharacterized protein LOC131557272 n=1 Tax=Ammospiza caudacuta TaxID=2857398 RepID=UPI0027394C52|nr:uncharacterized protein LOC131557272 [Ammospiza caudacuta]
MAAGPAVFVERQAEGAVREEPAASSPGSGCRGGATTFSLPRSLPPSFPGACLAWSCWPRGASPVPRTPVPAPPVPHIPRRSPEPPPLCGGAAVRAPAPTPHPRLGGGPRANGRDAALAGGAQRRSSAARSSAPTPLERGEGWGLAGRAASSIQPGISIHPSRYPPPARHHPPSTPASPPSIPASLSIHPGITHPPSIPGIAPTRSIPTPLLSVPPSPAGQGAACCDISGLGGQRSVEQCPGRQAGSLMEGR